MEYIDVGRIARAIRRIQRIPFLGLFLRCAHLTSENTSIVLIAIASMIFVAPLSIILAIDFNSKIITFLFCMLVACIVGLLPLVASHGVTILNRLIIRHSFGSYNDWIYCFFGPKSRIPIRFPQDWLARIKTLLIFLLAVFFGFMFVIFLMAGPNLYIVIFYILLTSSWRYFRRLTLVSSVEILKTDPRKPILLLRSFGDDTIRFKRSFFGAKYYFEEKLAVNLWREGPVIAIGKPGESLPTFGACREYHTDETWQGRVRELIAKSRAVILLVGLTEALDWEVNQLRSQYKLRNSVFLLPPLQDCEISKRLQKFSTQFPEFPPVLTQGENWRNLCVVFDSDEKLICFTSRKRTPLDYSVAVHAAFSRLRI